MSPWAELGWTMGPTARLHGLRRGPLCGRLRAPRLPDGVLLSLPGPLLLAEVKLAVRALRVAMSGSGCL